MPHLVPSIGHFRDTCLANDEGESIGMVHEEHDPFAVFSAEDDEIVQCVI